MAISIPNLPTDNLYKFMALSGLFAMLASTLVVSYDLSQLSELQGTITATSDNINMLQDLGDAATTLRGDKYHAEAIELLKTNSINLNKHKFFLGTLADRQKLMRWVFVTGGLVSFLGFGLWYFKVQKHHDKILLSEAKKSNAEPTISPKSNKN